MGPHPGVPPYQLESSSLGCSLRFFRHAVQLFNRFYATSGREAATIYGKDKSRTRTLSPIRSGRSLSLDPPNYTESSSDA